MVFGKRKTKGPDAEIDAMLDKLQSSKAPADEAINNFMSKKGAHDKKVIKLLLLGAGESGKTTIRKQFQIIHGPGFDKKSRIEYREKIWYNIVEGANAIVLASTNLQMPIKNQEALNASKAIQSEFTRISSHGPDSETAMTQELADAICAFWADDDVKAIYRRNAEFQIQESFNCFADKLAKYPTWGGPSWVPEREDILLCRVRTSGIVDISYVINGNTFRVIDVGGQRNERRKWLGLFKDVTGLIFVAAMSGYDQKIFEDDQTNRLEESLELWEGTANKPEFESSALILFLNKFDLFQRKYYDDAKQIKYEGAMAQRVEKPPKSENEKNRECLLAKTWFIQLYKEHLGEERKMRVVPHVTTALDESNMETVIGACAVHILSENMKLSGLVPQV